MLDSLLPQQPAHQYQGDHRAEQFGGDEARKIGLMPVNVSVSDRATATAGLANEVEAVNQ